MCYYSFNLFKSLASFPEKYENIKHTLFWRKNFSYNLIPFNLERNEGYGPGCIDVILKKIRIPKFNFLPMKIRHIWTHIYIKV